MYVIGGLDDQLLITLWSKLSTGFFKISPIFSYYTVFFRNYLNPFLSNQPIYSFILSLFGTMLGNYAMIFTVVVSLIVALSVSWLFFKPYKYFIFYTLLFVFSSYVWVHLGIHLYLSQIWVYPLFLLGLKKLQKSTQSVKEVLVLGFLLAFTIGISNYMGFFLVLYFSLYSFLKFFLEKNFKYLTNFFFVILFSSFLSIAFLFPYIESNYMDTSVVVGSGALAQVPTVIRPPYEDFFHFSSRPWYFFLPPVKNPWLGELSQNIIAKIETADYFLADDYFAGEHSANYFGLVFLLSVTVLSIIMLKKAPKDIKKKITFYWLLNLLLYLFMMPPFFTISGIKFFTLGELVYRFFPMFRVTTRMAPLLLVNFLIILATSVDYLSKKHPLFFKIFIPILTIVTLMETFIPLKIVYYNQPPEVYSYLGEIAPQEKFAVYPYSQTDEAFFWIDAHKGYLLNIRGYKDADYSSEELTKSLPTKEGIAKLKSLGGKYLLVYKNLTSSKDLAFYRNSAGLRLLKEASTYLLFEVL